jgi:hypothetical protein
LVWCSRRCPLAGRPAAVDAVVDAAVFAVAVVAVGVGGRLLRRQPAVVVGAAAVAAGGVAAAVAAAAVVAVVAAGDVWVEAAKMVRAQGPKEWRDRARCRDQRC